MASATARVNSLAVCQCLMKVALKSLSAASAGTESRTAHTNVSLVMSNTSGLSLYPVQAPKQQPAYAPSEGARQAILPTERSAYHGMRFLLHESLVTRRSGTT